MIHSHTFPSASHRLHVFNSFKNFDWFIGLSEAFVIGQSDHIGFENCCIHKKIYGVFKLLHALGGTHTLPRIQWVPNGVCRKIFSQESLRCRAIQISYNSILNLKNSRNIHALGLWLLHSFISNSFPHTQKQLCKNICFLE